MQKAGHTFLSYRCSHLCRLSSFLAHVDVLEGCGCRRVTGVLLVGLDEVDEVTWHKLPILNSD